MAISPNDARQMTADDAAEIAVRETRVDAAIKDRFRHGMSIWLDTEMFGHPGLVRDAVVQRYRDAGWVVTYHDDRVRVHRPVSTPLSRTLTDRLTAFVRVVDRRLRTQLGLHDRRQATPHCSTCTCRTVQEIMHR